MLAVGGVFVQFISTAMALFSQTYSSLRPSLHNLLSLILRFFFIFPFSPCFFGSCSSLHHLGSIF